MSQQPILPPLNDPAVAALKPVTQCYKDLLASLQVTRLLYTLQGHALRTSIEAQTIPIADVATLLESCSTLQDLISFASTSFPCRNADNKDGRCTNQTNESMTSASRMMGALSLRVAPSPHPSASFVHPTPRDDCQRPTCAHNSHAPLPTSISIGSLPDSVLINVISYLTGGARETTDPAGGHVSHAFHNLSHKEIRVQLGDIRAVALRWSVVATADELWEPVVVALWPVTQSLSPSLLPSLSPSMCRSSLEGLSANGSASLGLYPSWRFHGTHSFHDLCLRRGRAIVNPGLCLVTPQWSARYRLHFHIFEERHSIPLFSGEGPLVCQEWQNHHEHRTILRLGPGAAVVTTTFSASGCGGGVGGRDVEGDGSAGGRGGWRQRVERFLTYGVAIRVTVIEAASGREALIYQSSSQKDRHCQEAAPGWPVPPHSIAVTDRAETWMSGKGGGASLPPLRSLFDFTVIPVGMTPSEGGRGSGREGGWERRCLYKVHAARIDPPVNTIAHTGIVGLVFLGHVHEVGLLLASLQWA